MTDDSEVGEPLLLTYKQTMKKLNISKSELYRLMRAGELTSIKLGPQICRISMADIRAYVKRLEEAHGIGSAA